MSSPPSVGKIVGDIYGMGWLHLFVGAGGLVLGVVRIFVRAGTGSMEDRAIVAFIFLPVCLLVSFLPYVIVKEFQLSSALHRMASKGEQITDSELAKRTLILMRCAMILHVLVCRARGTTVDEIISSVMGSSHSKKENGAALRK